MGSARKATYLVAAALLSAAAAKAAPKPLDAWILQPTEAEFEAALPEAARGQGVRGRAVMQCDIVVSGALDGCIVVRESPAGLGLGAALLGLSGKYRRTPTTAGPRSVVVSSDWYQVDTAPDWIVPPTYALLLEVWPKAARKNGVDGDVVIDCVLTPDGVLTECITLEENPPGFGFGDAAIFLTAELSLWPARLKGSRTTSQVKIPFRFRRNASADWPSEPSPR